jgi:Carboxypeptidase regulatory-like domain
MSTSSSYRRSLTVLALLAAFVSQAAWASAHTGGNISGIVRDAATGAPLADVNLRISSPSQTETVMTDSQGHFIAFTLQPGEYTVTADKDGYGAQAVIEYIVDADQTELCDFRLGPPVVSATQ